MPATETRLWDVSK